MNLYYSYTYVTWGIIAGLVLFLFFKPKAALKTIAGLATIFFIMYCATMLGNTSSTGMGSKKEMINQTRDKID
jgi:hypothetical protein